MEKLKLKQAVIVLLTMIGLLSGQVYAAQAQVESLQAQPVATFTEAEVNALFINALFDHNADQPIQLAALSQQEMMETEGAAWPWVIRGGVTGVIGAGAGAGMAWNNGHRGWGVARGAAIGFAAGATGGVASRWLGRRGW